MFTAALLAGLPSPVPAQQAPEDRDRWQVGAEISYTDQSGNNDLRLFTAGLELSHLERDDFRLDASVHSRYGRSEGELVARNHYASLAFDLHPQNDWSPFVFADAERDPFKRLDARLSSGAGAKYTFVHRDGANEMSASLALLYAFENLARSEAEPDPPDRHRARWSLRLRGGRELRTGMTFQHLTFYQPLWDEVADYLLRSETGFTALLTERLALSVEYQFDRTARPPSDVEPDDRLLKTGLIINF